MQGEGNGRVKLYGKGQVRDRKHHQHAPTGDLPVVVAFKLNSNSLRDAFETQCEGTMDEGKGFHSLLKLVQFLNL